MDIKFRELITQEGETSKGIWKAYQIAGTKLSDGQDWKSSNIFINKDTQDLTNKLEALEPGDKVKVNLVKRGKFWNVDSVTPLADNAGANTRSTMGGAPAKGGGGGWKPDPTKNRGVALSYMVKDVLPQLHTEASLRKMDMNDYLQIAFQGAEIICDYLEHGTVEHNWGDGDPLEPPV